MKNKSLSLLVTGLALAVSFSTPALAGDAAAGQTKSAVCSSCHGADGNSMNPIWPKLAGQHANYLAKQLAEFKDGTRKDATMVGMTAALSEQDMQDLASYYASQAVKIGEANPDMVELGKKIYQAGIADKGVTACMACHGPSGKGNAPAGFPSLSGQHVDYTVKALTDFQRGDRVNDLNSMMRATAFKMTPREMKAVAEYISGLH